MQGPFSRTDRALTFPRAFMISAGFILLIAIGAIWAVIALQKFVTFPRAHHSLHSAGAYRRSR